MAKNYRLKGHGSFVIREGWITKALLAIQEYEKQNPDKNFFSKENFNGADSLGVVLIWRYRSSSGSVCPV